MSTQFALDLRLARKKAGYTQGDVAHLLSVHQSAISDLERGQIRPTLEQIIELSLIYGRSFERLFGEVMEEAKTQLRNRLQSLPDRTHYAHTVNRSRSLHRLKARLVTAPDHGSA